MTQRRFLLPSFFAVFGIVACLVTLLLYMYGELFTDWYYQAAYQERVERELGITLSMVPFQTSQSKPPFEVLAISRVLPGGLGAKAGIHDGDLPQNLSPCRSKFQTIGEFCAYWVNCPGPTFIVCVCNKDEVPFRYGDQADVVEIPHPGKAKGN